MMERIMNYVKPELIVVAVVHLMALPAADFSKICWNRIRLILAGTVRQGD